MQVAAAIITVGDELLVGQVVDTNSAWIGSVLSATGLPVKDIHSVSDSVQAITEALDYVVGRFAVVVITGGLGPTKDDITKHTLASYFGVGLERDHIVYEHVRSLMLARGVEFNSLNEAQADVPQGFTVLHNAVGTAPGLLFEWKGTLMFCLPGVPFEMKALVESSVLPIIGERLNLKNVVHRTVMIYGLPESELAEKISAWESALPDEIRLAYLPNARAIRLRLSAYGVDGVEVGARIESCFDELHALVPDLFLGYEPTSIEASLAAMLTRRGETFSTAESCTGGSIAARITALSGASAYFMGSVVAYSNEAKTSILGVDEDLIAHYGAVSEPVVSAMAQGVLDVFGVDYSIATSGIAGPTGGTDTKPVGTVCVAIAGPWGVRSFTRNFGQPREVCVERSASFALNALRLAVNFFENNPL